MGRPATDWTGRDARLIEARNAGFGWRAAASAAGISTCTALERGVNVLGLPRKIERIIAPGEPGNILPADEIYDPPAITLAVPAPPPVPLTGYALAVSLGRPDIPGALPPGAALTWGAMVSGSCLEGMPYKR